MPPKGNANYAWVQHFIHHLAPNGYAGFVLANGSMSSNQSGEGEIRRAIVEIKSHGHVLTPGRYVGAEEIEDDGEPFGEKMKRLVGELTEQFAESARLEAAIVTNLASLGFAMSRSEDR